MHKFAYTEGDPVSGIDPRGRQRVEIGVVFRGMLTPGELGFSDGHVDLTIPVRVFGWIHNHARLIGFFTKTGGASGGQIGGLLGSFEGVLADANPIEEPIQQSWFYKHRPGYLTGVSRIRDARTGQIRQIPEVGTISKLEITETAFNKLLQAIDEKFVNEKPRFTGLGFNCSARAAFLLNQAGVLKGGISGIDSPRNLYEQLLREHGVNMRSESGMLGFKRVRGRSVINFSGGGMITSPIYQYGVLRHPSSLTDFYRARRNAIGSVKAYSMEPLTQMFNTTVY